MADVAVKPLPGPAQAGMVRKGLDRAAAPTLAQCLRPRAEGLPSGERFSITLVFFQAGSNTLKNFHRRWLEYPAGAETLPGSR
jgi:hypothetical protein